jgi:hypothetical protein
LSELGDDLEASGLEVERLSCNDRGWLTRLLRTRATVVLLDAAERVPAPLLIALVMLRRGGLMLTLHRQTSGIRVLTKCSVTVELLSSLVDELTGGDEPTRARAIALLGPKRGNVREILSALYEIAKDSA